MTSYEDDLQALVVDWAARADRVGDLMGTTIPATRVPAVVVDYR